MENLLCSVTQCDALCGSFLWLALTASQGYLCNTFRRRLGAKQSICQGRVSRTSETLQILASEGVVNTRMFQCKNLYMIEMTETWLKYTEVWLDPRRGCNNCQCRAVSQLRCSLGSDLSVESSISNFEVWVIWVLHSARCGPTALLPLLFGQRYCCLDLKPDGKEIFSWEAQLNTRFVDDFDWNW